MELAYFFLLQQVLHENHLKDLLQEVEKYCRLKAYIRNQGKTNVRQITKEQIEELLEQGRKEGKEDFLQKISNTSDIQGVNAS